MVAICGAAAAHREVSGCRRGAHRIGADSVPDHECAIGRSRRCGPIECRSPAHGGLPANRQRQSSRVRSSPLARYQPASSDLNVVQPTASREHTPLPRRLHSPLPCPGMERGTAESMPCEPPSTQQASRDSEADSRPPWAARERAGGDHRARCAHRHRTGADRCRTRSGRFGSCHTPGTSAACVDRRTRSRNPRSGPAAIAPNANVPARLPPDISARVDVLAPQRHVPSPDVMRIAITPVRATSLGGELHRRPRPPRRQRHPGISRCPAMPHPPLQSRRR